jgi:V8-like Glu-specific endopeptidase
MTRAARKAALTSVIGLLVAGAAAVTFGQASAQTRAPARTRASAQTLAAARTRAGAGAAAGHGRPAPVRHAVAVTVGQQARVRRYWTPARMEHATALRPGRPHAATKAVPAASHRQAPAGSHRQARAGAARQARTRRALLSAALVVQPRAALRPQARRQLAATANGALWNHGGAVARTTGKVFFTLGSHDYVCSGSTVASANAAVVVTAGHCVKDGTGSWAANWTFVPGYANGKAPYGAYTARRFYVARQWSTHASNDYDVAFITLNQATVGGTRIAAVREVGGQGIEFGSQPARENAFGYPADPPYNGQKLAYCSGTVRPDPYQWTTDTGLRCAMTAGSSGGPWLSSFNQAAGTGIIASVSSFKYSTNSQILYGPALGSTAQALYQAAERG